MVMQHFKQLLMHYPYLVSVLLAMLVALAVTGVLYLFINLIKYGKSNDDPQSDIIPDLRGISAAESDLLAHPCTGCGIRTKCCDLYCTALEVWNLQHGHI